MADKYTAIGWKYRPNSSLKVKRFFVPKGSNPSEEALDNIALLEEYVAEDDGAFGAPLCMRSLCCMPEGHGGECKEPG